MMGVQVWGYNDVTQQVPFFLQRTCEEWFPENVTSEEDPCGAGPWLLLKLFSLSQSFYPLPSSAESYNSFLLLVNMSKSVSPSWLSAP